MDTNTIKSLPKVELHCHLDGSVRLATLENLAEKEGISTESLKKIIAPKKCQNLKEYLESFARIIPLLQSEKNLAIAAYDLVEQAAEESVCYIEIRFAPLLHQEQGLSIPQIIQAVWSGVLEAQKKFKVHVNLIVSALRHHSEKENSQLIESIRQLNSEAVSGFDFAGDEAAISNAQIKTTIDRASQAGLKLTLHSGECGCAQNVVEAIYLGAKRIGHGVAIKDCEAIMRKCADKEVLLELCPTSNIQTNAIMDWEDYPLRTFIENQVRCCINTDNRTVSQTTLTNEYQLLMTHCGLSYSEMKTLNLNAIEGSFADNKLKEQLIEQVKAGYKEVEEK